MSNRSLLVIGAIALVVALYYSTRKKPSVKHDEPEIEETTEAQTAPIIKPRPVITSADLSKAQSGDNSIKAYVPAVKPTQLSDQVLRQFSNHLRSMNNCLGLSAPQSDVMVQPTIDNLLQNLRSSLGDSVMQSEDFIQTEIIDKDSSRKRVRVDYDYIDGTNYNRRLSMYQINSYGMPEIMDLTSDQSNNPNQAYVESLIEGNQVTVEERGARVYFSQAEEVVFTMKNGILQNVSVNRADRAFNCFNLGEENSNCTCP